VKPTVSGEASNKMNLYILNQFLIPADVCRGGLQTPIPRSNKLPENLTKKVKPFTYEPVPLRLKYEYNMILLMIKMLKIQVGWMGKRT